MNYIQGIDRFQISFSSLDDQVDKENPVRIIDAFIDKLDLDLLGFVSKTIFIQDAGLISGKTLAVDGSKFRASNKHGTTQDYLVTKFTYHQESDSYTCPQGKTLTTTGTWHKKTRERDHHMFKKYRTTDCKTCPVKHLCTGRKDGGREGINGQMEKLSKWEPDYQKVSLPSKSTVLKSIKALWEDYHPFPTISKLIFNLNLIQDPSPINRLYDPEIGFFKNRGGFSQPDG